MLDLANYSEAEKAFVREAYQFDLEIKGREGNYFLLENNGWFAKTAVLHYSIAENRFFIKSKAGTLVLRHLIAFFLSFGSFIGNIVLVFVHCSNKSKMKKFAQMMAAKTSSGDLNNSPQSGSTKKDYLDQLEKLGELKDKGILTEAEFEEKKKSILGSVSSQSVQKSSNQFIPSSNSN